MDIVQYVRSCVVEDLVLLQIRDRIRRKQNVNRDHAPVHAALGGGEMKTVCYRSFFQ